MSKELIPITLQPFILELGKYLAKHENCLDSGNTLEVNTEFLYCQNCKNYEEINN